MALPCSRNNNGNVHNCRRDKACFSIGGGYAIILLIQEKVVNQTGWISEKMFTDIITISQNDTRATGC
uniref:Chromate transporter n=1 Tax=Clostridioides difficile TaxID=1496 RepID=A0A381I4Q8_CLODI|nr:chromate transporter [Clostridioides difficile]